MRVGGALFLGAPFGGLARGTEAAEISMRGDASGSNVSFDPIGLHMEPGGSVRWTNRDQGNSHTATACHPSVDNHPLRIPSGAQPFDSDYLLPGESFALTLTIEGVYDYFCIPHEHAGMVGRIVVGRPRVDDQPYPSASNGAFGRLPTVREIIAGRGKSFGPKTGSNE